MYKSNARYYLTPNGKVGKFVKLTNQPDLYHLDINGKIVTYSPQYLSFIPEEKLSVIRLWNKTPRS